MKSKKKEQTRNRVRIFRGINSIMKKDNAHLIDTIKLRKTLSEKKTNSEDHKIEPTLLDKLRSWIFEYHVKRNAVSSLLKILISIGITSLPKDSRSLMKTPRMIQIDNIAGGQYWHSDLTSSLKRIFGKLKSDLSIKININMDGLQLYKGSPITFWPILANIHGVYDACYMF